MSDAAMIAAVLGRTPQSLSILDAHAHLGPYAVFPIPDPWEESMVAVMDRAGVNRTIISAILGLVADAAAGNDLTARAVARFPDRFAGYAAINPHQQPEQELRRALALPGMVALKLHPDLHQYPMSGPKYEPVWEVADRYALTVLVHGYDGSPFDGPEKFGQVAARYPNVRLMMGHTCALETGFEKALPLAREYPNLYLELCGSWMTGRWLARMVREVGASKILYGSDFPFIDMRFALGRVLFADIAPGDKRLILGETAAGLIEASRAGVGRYLSEVQSRG